MILGPVLMVLAVGIYGLLHSLLASSWAKGKAGHWFGQIGVRGYRLVFNGLGGLFFLPILLLVAKQPGPVLYRATGVWLLQTDVWHFIGLRQLIQGDTDVQAELAGEGFVPLCTSSPVQRRAALPLVHPGDDGECVGNEPWLECVHCFGNVS